MRRINAFTLIELVVVMLISAIVFAMVFYAYSTVVRFQISQGKNNSTNQEYRTLNMLLENDFLSSDELIQKNDYELLCVFKRDREVTYRFSDNFITRSFYGDVNLTDTFFVKSDQPYITMKYLREQQDLVNELTINIIADGNGLLLHYKKEYSPDILINKQLDKEANEFH
jgi:prepilin-type N-terminal cleavage/methylation domain-containing protein